MKLCHLELKNKNKNKKTKQNKTKNTQSGRNLQDPINTTPHSVPFMNTNYSLSKHLTFSLTSHPRGLTSASEDHDCPAQCPNPNPSMCFWASVPRGLVSNPCIWECLSHKTELALPPPRRKPYHLELCKTLSVGETNMSPEGTPTFRGCPGHKSTL